MVASDEPTVRDEDAASGALRRGAPIGRYQVLRTLGQGGFGITYLARDTQLGRDVALKEYLPEYFAMRGDDGVVLPRSTRVAADFLWGRERFIEEARTLARFGGTPGVVEVYDFLEANGTAYMVMALVRGETMEIHLTRDKQLKPATIERLLDPLLDGLERVHEADVLHRDIKPSNIMIDPSGRSTLIDFGASRMALQGRTRTLTAVYTPGYAAFEQMTAAKQGPWTDIYALAATLYHCVTGAPPPQAADRVMEDEMVPAARSATGRYPSHLLAAIDAGLAVKANDRPRTIAAWRALLSPGAGIASPAPLPSRMPEVPTVIERPPLASPAPMAVASMRDRIGTSSAQGPELVQIPAGRFEMGAAQDEEELVGFESRYLDDARPRCTITVAKDFALGRYPVTVGEFRTFVDASNYVIDGDWRAVDFQKSDRDHHPVVCVSWHDAMAYAQWLSSETSAAYRLPSEAEWEYAARAGTSSARYWGDPWGEGDRYALANAKPPGTRVVGSLRPNAFGLHDMLGNVQEWTADAWNSSLRGQPPDATPRLTGIIERRVIRGGSWSLQQRYVCAAMRDWTAADFRINFIGFRVARTL